jgi:hypothetical protein
MLLLGCIVTILGGPGEGEPCDGWGAELNGTSDWLDVGLTVTTLGIVDCVGGGLVGRDVVTLLLG